MYPEDLLFFCLCALFAFRSLVSMGMLCIQMPPPPPPPNSTKGHGVTQRIADVELQ